MTTIDARGEAQMIEFYTAPTSNGRRVAIMLEECGLAYRVHALDLAQGEQRRPEYLEINPAGQIPCIVDPEGPDGQPFAIAQSGAILLYLAEKTGRFLPVDPYVRASAYQWLVQALSDTASASMSMFLLSGTAPEKSEANVAFFEQRVARFLRTAEAQLADRDYLATELSIADFALYPLCVVRRGIIDAAGDMPNLTRWMERLAARPAISRAMG